MSERGTVFCSGRSWPVYRTLVAVGLLMLAPAANALAQPSTLIEIGDTWKYFKGTVAPPTDWAADTFDDAGWLEGPTGIGYSDNDDATVLDDMQGGYIAFFARRKFNVADLGTVTRLVLAIDYDDGFVAYINGVEVHRRHLPDAPAVIEYNTAATDREAGTVTSVDIGTANLKAGTNVLAIELHNSNIDSSDASLIPRLIANGSLPPEGLTCAYVAGPPASVTLAWTNSGTYTAIRVERNGAKLADLAGDAVTYTDSTFDGLDTTYRVVGIEGGQEYPSVDCTVACTQVTITCTLALVDGKTQATVAWTGTPAGTTSISISREGAAAVTVDPTATQYVDPDVESEQPEDDTGYTVTFTKADGRTCTVGCGASLCVQNLSTQVAGSTIRLSWGNLVKLWDHFEISRNGTVVDAAVPGTATSWTDPNVVLVVGESYDYLLHPVAVDRPLPDPGTVCDLAATIGYAPEIASYAAPAGGWDYELNFKGANKRQYNPNTGEKGNLDGQWIRANGRDLWDGSAPFETGPAPDGPAPGGLDIVDRNGLGPCKTNTTVLRLLDPGDPGAGIGTAFPDPFDPPNNGRIFLGFDTGVTGKNLLKTGVTFSARLRASPDAPAYMNPNPFSGDGGPIHNGYGHVGIYYRPPDGSTDASVAASFCVNSGNDTGDLEFSQNPMEEVDAMGTLNFIAIWMTVQEGATADTYDVNIYLNGSLTPSTEVSGTGLALQAFDRNTADFGADIANFLAIGSNDTGGDAMVEIDYIAYKAGIFTPSVGTQCQGGGGTNFRRGDADGKGGVPNITDGIFVLNFLFTGGPEPPCMEAANGDDKGGVNITDGIYILNYLFQGGPAPPAPGPDACGPEPAGSLDDLGCISYPGRC